MLRASNYSLNKIITLLSRVPAALDARFARLLVTTTYFYNYSVILHAYAHAKRAHAHAHMTHES